MTQSYPTGAIEVGPGAYAFIQADGATDAGFLVEEDGVIIIDTLMTRALADQLMAEVRAVTDKPVRYVVNTHWHGDHVFGNAVVPPAPIIAHHTAREDLLAEWDPHRAFLRDLYPPLWEQIAGFDPVPPNLTFSRSVTLHLGKRPVVVEFYGRAHTRGDIAVHLPTEGVMFAGDISFHDYIPNARDGFPSDWVAVADVVSQADVGVIVPGHGRVGTTQDLADMRDCLALIVGQARTAFDDGKSEEEALAGLRLGPYKTWGRQEDRLPTLVGRCYREFRGELG